MPSSSPRFTVTFGGWYQRTTLHLSEIYDLFALGHSGLKLEQTKLVGCGVKNWQGKPVTMVCFHTGKPLAPNEKSDLFLFVVDRGALADSPEQNQLLMARVNTLSTVTWAEGERVYLLASPDETVLRETLSVKSL